MSADIYQKIAELVSRCERIAVATVVKTEESTPQDVGAKIIIKEDGNKFGTISGGCLENAVIEEAQQALKGPLRFKMKEPQQEKR
jgi:xanthine dehydrogenase accessory factor